MDEPLQIKRTRHRADHQTFHLKYNIVSLFLKLNSQGRQRKVDYSITVLEGNTLNVARDPFVIILWFEAYFHEICL